VDFMMGKLAGRGRLLQYLPRTNDVKPAISTTGASSGQARQFIRKPPALVALEPRTTRGTAFVEFLDHRPRRFGRWITTELPWPICQKREKMGSTGCRSDASVRAAMELRRAAARLRGDIKRGSRRNHSKRGGSNAGIN